MKDSLLIAVALFSALLQMTVFPFLDLFGVRPNLCLIILIAFTACFGQLKGIRMGIYLGLSLDVLIGKGLGVYTFLYMLIAYIFSSIEEKIFKDNLITPLILIVSASVIEYLFFWVLSYMSMSYSLNLGLFLKNIIVFSAYNSLIGIPIYTFILHKYYGYGIR